jgi:hypothetical protein
MPSLQCPPPSVSVAGLEGDRFPVELLRGRPFRSYVVPGLIRAGLVGGSAAVATVAGLRRPRMVAQASALAGIVLMGWILGEVLIVRSSVARSWLEPGYFGVGLLMSTLGLVEWWWNTAGHPLVRTTSVCRVE